MTRALGGHVWAFAFILRAPENLGGVQREEEGIRRVSEMLINAVGRTEWRGPSESRMS